MARAKKEAALTPEERLQAALVPDWEWPYKLPENWCWTRITVITDILNGFAFKSQHYSSAGIRIIRITNVQDGFIQDKKPVYYPLESQKEITPFILKDGDFLMSLILFNDTDRFSLLYNNLKGRIVQIELFDSRIRFTVDVEIPLTEQDCQNDGIEFIDIIDDVTRIRFDVFDFEEEMADEDRKKTIVPFQLAYAVSIHKAQGLEYRSVKVAIPSSNAEKITHGIFYTAITRAKEKLKIYWSSETMQEVVAGFSTDTSRQKSLAIIKEKLKQDKNT